MKKKALKPKPPKSWRPSEEDQKLLDDLREKWGVSEPDVVRIALRRLAEAEGLRA